MLISMILVVQILLPKSSYILQLRWLTKRVQRMLWRLFSLFLIGLLNGDPASWFVIMVPGRIEELNRISLIKSKCCHSMPLFLWKHQIRITLNLNLFPTAKANLVNYLEIWHICVSNLYLVFTLVLNIRLLYYTRTIIILFFNDLIWLWFWFFKFSILLLLLIHLNIFR